MYIVDAHCMSVWAHVARVLYDRSARPFTVKPPTDGTNVSWHFLNRKRSLSLKVRDNEIIANYVITLNFSISGPIRLTISHCTLCVCV